MSAKNLVAVFILLAVMAAGACSTQPRDANL